MVTPNDIPDLPPVPPMVDYTEPEDVPGPVPPPPQVPGSPLIPGPAPAPAPTLAPGPGLISAPPTPMPTLDAATQARLARAAEMEQAMMQQQLRAALEQFTKEKQTQFESMGMLPDQARFAAEQMRDREWEHFRQIAQRQAAQDFELGRSEAALFYGQQYGVDPRLLRNAKDENEMKQLAEREQRYRTQEARIKKLEQERVPAQQFDTGRVSPRSGGDRRSRLIEKGQRGGLTSAEALELWGRG